MAACLRSPPPECIPSGLDGLELARKPFAGREDALEGAMPDLLRTETCHVTHILHQENGPAVLFEEGPPWRDLVLNRHAVEHSSFGGFLLTARAAFIQAAEIAAD